MQFMQFSRFSRFNSILSRSFARVSLSFVSLAAVAACSSPQMTQDVPMADAVVSDIAPPPRVDRDATQDVPRADATFGGQCLGGTEATGWVSSTEVSEVASDGVCPTIVTFEAFAGRLDCGSVEGCCRIDPACRFQVNSTFYDNRPDPCTGLRCFPPNRRTFNNCRCENGVIRCSDEGQWAFPFHICSDCYRPHLCADGGFPPG